MNGRGVAERRAGEAATFTVRIQVARAG